MTKLIIRTFVIGMLLSAVTAVAQAQDAAVLSSVTASIAVPRNDLPVRERAMMLAVQAPGTRVCYAEGLNTLHASKEDAQDAVFASGEIHHREVTCLRYAQK
jgi:hypothetical protein